VHILHWHCLQVNSTTQNSLNKLSTLYSYSQFLIQFLSTCLTGPSSPESTSGSGIMETPSQATLRSTAPPTATPSQATTNAATAPPPPADYKPVDGESKRTQKLILIICFKLLCLVSHHHIS